MMAATVSIEVNVPPRDAFAIFTDEIETWWRPGPRVSINAARAIGVRIEHGVGGRWLELYDDLGDDTYEIAEIIAWKRGESIELACHRLHDGDDTRVALRFAPTTTGTTLTLSHEDPTTTEGADARTGWAASLDTWQTVLTWYQEWANWGSPRRIRDHGKARRAYVLAPKHGVLGDDGGLKASRRSTIGSMSVMVSTTTGGAPPHVHTFDDEAFYVLDGTMTVDFDDTRHELGQGGFAFIPRGCPHAWDTIGEATVLIVTAPGGIEEFLHALHTGGDAYAETWRRIGPRFGYEML